ncbi:uncharacterized protein MELLADRAFT_102591 [Melampsora larici-populina 98AG31]|uniref:Uncharacterized protein n=1 Tax=Melampsora larici-populina (strain 98AG31 / pathotype 3-4-7) TaxID=747676 RepID=F4R8R7_MELLP|nr:uncharacterized protein MELLADRAFT_102591 [Melampsora larici-populina 98AG31]EGG10852.1 hypothetical protein MELLADRAFT_102591 [Melampsora larici-populina 98AG31]
MSRNGPSADFQRLYLTFINLGAPIHSEQASSLMQLIVKHLGRQNIPQNGFDEETNTVRLLLHLEEYHDESYLRFKKSINSGRVQEKILESDISFQLADEKLAPPFKSLLTEFRNTKTINLLQITRLLQSLEHEQISIPQLGRLFRALNLVINRNRAIYTDFHVQLNGHSEIVPKLFKMLTQRRYGQLDPQSFTWDSLEYLIYIEITLITTSSNP